GLRPQSIGVFSAKLADSLARKAVLVDDYVAPLSRRSSESLKRAPEVGAMSGSASTVLALPGLPSPTGRIGRPRTRQSNSQWLFENVWLEQRGLGSRSSRLARRLRRSPDMAPTSGALRTVHARVAYLGRV